MPAQLGSGGSLFQALPESLYPHMVKSVRELSVVSFISVLIILMGLSWCLSGEESACQGRRHRFDPWVGKIPWRRKWQPTPVFLPGESHGQRSLVGYSPRVSKSRTRLSDFPFTFHFNALEKEMATHSSVLAWRIPGTGKPGGLPSMGSHRVGHD